MSTNSPCLFEYQSPGEVNDDALFLERLDTFMEKSLTEIKAFAEREMRPYDEVFGDPFIGMQCFLTN